MPMGYKQTAEHIEKRKRFGAANANWKGESQCWRQRETMSKQTKIRGDIFLILQNVRLGKLSEYEATIKLQELGVVITVERELPENPYPKSIFTMDVGEGGRIQREKLGDKLTTSVNGAFGRHVYSFCQQDMLKARYAAFEPLIEEKDAPSL